MPTYQYACTTCGHQLEAVQSFSDDPLTECPACQGRLRKQFSAVGIVFKGSGFYRTDARNDARRGSSSSRNGSRELAGVGSASKGSAETSSTSGSSGSESAKSTSSTGTASTGSSSTGSSTATTAAASTK